MQFAAKIGDREVLAAGVLALGGQDREMTFLLDGVEFVVRLAPRLTPLAVKFIRNTGDEHLTIEIGGEFPAFSFSWRLTGVAYSGSRQIDLDVIIHSLSDRTDSDRQFTFCFTAHPASGTPSLPSAVPLSFGHGPDR